MKTALEIVNIVEQNGELLTTEQAIEACERYHAQYQYVKLLTEKQIEKWWKKSLNEIYGLTNLFSAFQSYILNHIGDVNEGVEGNLFEKLKLYFENTPHDKILEDWKKSKGYDNIGITVTEFQELIKSSNVVRDNTEEKNIKVLKRERLLTILISAYDNAIQLIREWHGMGMKKDQEEQMWKIYSTTAPEMKALMAIKECIDEYLNQKNN